MRFIIVLACSVILTVMTGVALLRSGIIQFHSPVQDANSSTAAAPPAHVKSSSRRHVYDMALAFLEKSRGEVSPDLENRFRKFLRHDLKLGKHDADRLMRMCLWKNYVSMQDAGNAASKAGAGEELQWEQRLKRAGFAAMGLPLFGTPAGMDNHKEESGTAAGDNRS